METHEYPEYVSRFYDVVYASLRSGVDSDYFNRKIREAKGPVLEVGTGTGRFFLEALQHRADIYGIDTSATMLQQLKNKLPHGEQHRVYRQDVRELNIPKKFELIVAPFRVFSHLLTIEDQLTALNKIHDHLAPGGTFIFDLFLPNLKMLHEGRKDAVDFDGYHAEGQKLQRSISASNDLINQVNNVAMTYTWDENGKTRSETWNFKMRYYFRFELELLIRQSKLNLLHLYGGYDEQPLTNESKDFVIVCGR